VPRFRPTPPPARPSPRDRDAARVDIARWLIAEKIAAQAQTLAAVPSAGVTETSLATIRDAVIGLHVAATRERNAC
jgi:hypothetical protein